MDFSSSSQNLEILMDSFWASTPSAAILYLLACYMISVRYSGWRVFRISKKYYLGGPLPCGNLSGKNIMNFWSFLNSGNSCLTDSSS